ncbi:MAG: phosphatase PAP2 family protein [Rhodoferax sp.]|uniref:phosphatase PAP2 family protein n=1 Tax=Rhodoferax sp. TaxID=50421 RepID=UPI002ACD8A6E|nr:phosphatase PAP2 family protein [Rhodoferax sp.]MDZ7891537.1 phosphatase PAP2 family protein [Rhodoferax sp.]
MSPPVNSTPLLFWQLVAAMIVAALVPTLWPTLDIQTAALFVGDTPAIASRTWWWVELINAWVPAAFRVMLLVAAVGWLASHLLSRYQAWRLPLAFVVCAGIAGPGAVVNLGFKENWQRARPYQVEIFGGTQQFTRATVITDQCDNNCSFVSGHVACGFFFCSLMLIQARRRKWWLIAGTAAGLAIGFSRMSAVAHWFSDVLWAGPITLMTSWLVWKILSRLYAPSGDETKPVATSG